MKHSIILILVLIPLSISGQDITFSTEILNTKDPQIEAVRDLWKSYVTNSKNVDKKPSLEYWNKSELDLGFTDIIMKVIDIPYRNGNLSISEIKKVDKDYFKFAYDYSTLQKTKEILLEAVFKLKKINPMILKERAQSAFEYRKKTQPMGAKTSGCFFKNVDGKSAGQMIDKAELKGFAVGDFFVSPIHANFIINRGHGRSKDLLKLVRIIKEKVKQKFGVKLEEEVMII